MAHSIHVYRIIWERRWLRLAHRLSHTGNIGRKQILMSLPQHTSSFSDDQTGPAACPAHAHSLPRQKTRQIELPAGPPIECDDSGVWHIRGFDEARAILRSKDTRQAGFNADQV